MTDNDMINEWISFAEMDLKVAMHLDSSMRPKPLEVICYHCQQATEKLLKAALLQYGEEIKKTHDLGLLAEMLSEHITVEEQYIEMCDALTPYGVKIRYPQELNIEEFHATRALKDAIHRLHVHWFPSVVLEITAICCIALFLSIQNVDFGIKIDHWRTSGLIDSYIWERV